MIAAGQIVPSSAVIPAFGATALTVPLNVSEEDRTLVSVAVTVIPIVWAVAGAVPENVSVLALNVSQEGSADPVDRVAD